MPNSTGCLFQTVCFELQLGFQEFFLDLDTAHKLQMIDELRRLVQTHRTQSGGRISIAKPLKVADGAITLPPLQMTRFPLLTYVSSCS